MLRKIGFKEMYYIKIWIDALPPWPTKLCVEVIVLIIIWFLVCMGRVVFLQWTIGRCFISWILVSYLIVIYAFTVFSRNPHLGYAYKLNIFWSYREGVGTYGKEIIFQNILNIFMLLPIGLLFPFIVKGEIKCKNICGMITVCIGLTVSVTIELLQLILRRGLFEFDDIIHNTLGVALGFLIYCGARNVWNRIHRKN